MYDGILLPTDGSEAAEAMLTHGIKHAQKWDATVHALYVVDETESSTTIVGTDDDARHRLTEQGEAAVDEIAERANGADVEVTTAVREGTPHKEILAHADERDADMIVMSTHGRTGVSRVLIGSVTERVIRLSDCPVLAVNRPDTE